MKPEDSALLKQTRLPVMNNKRSFPRKMLSGLERYGVKATFLDHVRELRPGVYRQWKKYLGE